VVSVSMALGRRSLNFVMAGLVPAIHVLVNW
jgi:hypothetical protein